MFRSHCHAINFAPQIQPVTCLLRGIPPLLALGDFLRAYGEINEAPFLKYIFQKQKQKYPLWYGAGDPTARLLYFACRTPFACCAQLRGTGCVLRLWCTVYTSGLTRMDRPARLQPRSPKNFRNLSDAVIGVLLAHSCPDPGTYMTL
jgi:hypothetical protein